MAKKFGARQSNRYTVVCTLPDVCYTPKKPSKGGPVPYIISVKLDTAENVVKKTNFNGDKVFVFDKSKTPKCKGDKPGRGKGVTSNTVGDECVPTDKSPSVRAEGKPVVREGDSFDMNKKNTVGKLVTTDAGSQSVITDEGIEESEEHKKWQKETCDKYGLSDCTKDNLADALNKSIEEGQKESARLNRKIGFLEGVMGALSGIVGVGDSITMGGVSGVGEIINTQIYGADAAAASKAATQSSNMYKGAELATDVITLPKTIAKTGAQKLIKKSTKTKPPKKKTDGVKVKRIKKTKVKCFNKKQDKHSKKEYDKQLKDQQDGLNKMTADDYLKGREAFDGITCKDGKASTNKALKNRPKRNAKEARDARKKHEEKLVDKYEKADSKTPEADAKAEMKTLAALHNPDMVAAGQDLITGFGDKGINSSIGTQWKDRVGDIDTAACKAKQEKKGKDKMNVELSRCKKKK